MTMKKSTRNTQNQVPSKAMSEACDHNLLCSCRRNVSEIIDNVKNKIEECIVKYMSLEETMTYLQDNHKIGNHLTKIIWERLQKESPGFFKDYYLICETGRHMRIFNWLLGKQAAVMLEEINSGPNKPEVSLSSLALPDTYGPTVNQLQIPPHDHQYQCFTSNVALNELQIPNGQQNQLPQNQWSTPNDFTNNYDGAHPIAPAATNQRQTSNGLAYDSYPAFSTVATAATAQRPPSNGLPYIGGAPTVPLEAPFLPDDLFTFEDGDNFENNGPNVHPMDLLVAQLLTQPEYQLQDLSEQNQLQQNFSLEELQRQYGVNNNMLQNGGNNNGLQYGGSNKELIYGGTNHTLQNGATNNDGLQNGGSNNDGLQGVILHHHHHFDQEQELRVIQAPGEPQYQIPESKASDKRNSGDTIQTMAQDERDLQRKNEGRGLVKRRAI